MRAEYFPLRFLEPGTPGNRRALGLDVGVIDGTPVALATARDTGRLAMSAAIQVGETPADRGTALAAAVYRTGAPLRTVAERRAALRGFVSGAWRYDRLAAPIVALLPAGARLEITDAGEPVFRSPGSPGVSATEVISLGGRPWTVRVSLPAGATRWVQLAAVIGGGLTLTALVALLLAQAGRRRREREAGQKELHHEANSDGLTGLGNRRKLGVTFGPPRPAPPPRRRSASSCSTSTASRATTTASVTRPATPSWRGSAGAWPRRFPRGGLPAGRRRVLHPGPGRPGGPRPAWSRRPWRR